MDSGKYTGFWALFKPSLRELRNNDPLRMAGATAFFTTFALAPILIILFQIFSLFVNQRMVGSQMMEMLTNTFGRASANQIRVTTRGFRRIAQNWYIAVAGFVFLIFIATTLFTVVKNTLNDIWDIKLKEKLGFGLYMKLRARSLFVILLAGILFLFSVFLDGFEVLAGKYMEKLLAGGGKFFKTALNEVTGVLVVTIWFILLFRYLSDARPAWKVAITGGIITGILFSAGKAFLAYLMSHSNIGSIYGTSGSLVLLLLFVFYSSFILYYGACFIKVYSGLSGHTIKPLHHAFHYRLQETKI